MSHRLSRSRRQHRAGSGFSNVESLEIRRVPAADPLPVLMVLADRQDFYYQEYGDTRLSIEAAGLSVQVAATTTLPTTPHAGTGQGSSSGVVTPDIALADVDPADYSAIVFVGGWGASMYQYDFPGDYLDDRYDGDLATKAVVNDLINEFIDQDKYVTAICHGVTVLAWARVDGVSPIDGRNVSVPWIGSPAVVVNGQFYGYFELMAYTQAAENGAIANTSSGQYGNPNTVHDDVVVDGRIITAENYDSALLFGTTVAQHVIAQAAENEDEPPPPQNQAPIVRPAEFIILENSVLGTNVGQVVASDPDAGQSLTYQIVSGNTSGAFAIDASTGAITVSNAAVLDFETHPLFQLEVTATDNAGTPLTGSAMVSVALADVFEAPPAPVGWSGSDVLVQGTSRADTIYIWSGAGNQAFVWMNGTMYGPFALPTDGRVVVYAGEGADQIYATDARFRVHLYGQGGNDQMTGGSNDDLIDGGTGSDRIWGMQGNDILLGGDGDDFLDGREGDDIVVGGHGADFVAGSSGRDLLIGGLGYDRVDGGDGDDLLIGGTTAFDNDLPALMAILTEWQRPVSTAQRVANLGVASSSPLIARGLVRNETVEDDGTVDCLQGGAGNDALFVFATDCVNSPSDLFL